MQCLEYLPYIQIDQENAMVNGIKCRAQVQQYQYNKSTWN